MMQRLTKKMGIFNKLVAGSYMYAGGWRVIPAAAGVYADLLLGVTDVDLDFGVTSVGTMAIYFPFKVTISSLVSNTTSTFSGTDNATITCGNAVGASAGGVVTIAASAAVGDEDSATPTTNNVVAADSYYYLTTAKTTPNGKCHLHIKWTRTA